MFRAGRAASAAAARSGSAKRTGSPERAAQAAAGIANSGAASGAITTWRGPEPKRRSRSLAIARGRGRRAARGDPRDPAVDRRGDAADRERGRAFGRVLAGGPQRLERFGGGVREFIGGGEEQRGADRRRHQDRGGDRRGPVVFADQGDRGRPLRGRRSRGTPRAPTAAALAAGSEPPIRVVLLVAEGGIAERFGAPGVRAADRMPRRRPGSGRAPTPVSPFGPPPPPPSTAATMKPIAITTSAASISGVSGDVVAALGRRASRIRRPWSAVGARDPFGLLDLRRLRLLRRSGESALIGRSPFTAETLHAALSRWPTFGRAVG